MDKIIDGYKITIFVTVVGTFASTMMTAMLAYPLSRRYFCFRRAITIYVLIIMLFNGGLVSTYIVYVRILFAKDHIWALILPYLVNPFFVIVLRSFFTSSVSDSIIESAKIDGAGELRIFFTIVLPLAKAGMATIALFTSFVYWNDWFQSMLYMANDTIVSIQYLMVKVMNTMAFIRANPDKISGMGNNWNDLPGLSAQMAMAVIGMGPIILAYPFFQKHFIKGLTVGSIKG